MKISLLLSCILLAGSWAQAQFVLSPGIHYSSRSVDATTSPTGAIDSSTSTLMADIRLGYILPMGLYLGGMYSHQDGAGAVPYGLSGGDNSGNLIGATVGYSHPMGFNALLTYHIMGNAESSMGSTNVKFKGASGPQLDLAWVFPIASYFSIGPQITWKSIEYSNTETDSLPETATDIKSTSIEPYLAFWFMF